MALFSRPFFKEFFSLPDEQKVRIVAGADNYCRGSLVVGRCRNLTKKGECLWNFGREDYQVDFEVADFWGLPVGKKTTVVKVRETLLTDRHQRTHRL